MNSETEEIFALARFLVAPTVDNAAEPAISSIAEAWNLEQLAKSGASLRYSDLMELKNLLRMAIFDSGHKSSIYKAVCDYLYSCHLLKSSQHTSRIMSAKLIEARYKKQIKAAEAKLIELFTNHGHRPPTF